MAFNQLTSPTTCGLSPTTQFISVNLDELQELKPRRYCRMRRAFVWIIGLLVIAGVIGLVIGLVSPTFIPSNNPIPVIDCGGPTNQASTSVNLGTTGTTANPFFTWPSSTISTLSPNTGTTVSANTGTTVSANTGTTASPNTGTTVSANTGTTASPNTGTTASPNTGTTVSANTGTTSPSTIISTTAPCASGYSRAPSGACVNLLIDFNNCGSFGFACSSNYTSCSGGVCSGSAPPVRLVGGVSVPGWGGSISLDDAYVPINLPMSVTLYNYSTPNVSLSTNGVLCLSICSADFANTNLPTTSFGGPTALGYWDDLYITANTSQSVYYNVVGVAPNRTATFEFNTAHFSNRNFYYSFQILFYESSPNIVRYIYYYATDAGASATIGVQASSSGPFMSYSANQANSVTPNMVLTFNTNTGTITG